MRVLDDAIAAVLEAIAPDGAAVFYASAPRDWPGAAYYVHRSTDSRKGRIGVGGMGGSAGIEARQYEHSILAVHADDPDEAEAMRERAIARLQGLRLAPDGWQSTTPIDWAGEIHDPGDLLPGGALVYFAGDRWTVDIFRQRQ